MSWLMRSVTPTQVRNIDRLWLYGVGFFSILFLLIPTLIVIPMSFSDSQYLEFPPKNFSLRWFESYFGSTEWMRATYISLRAAVLTSLLATLIGTAAAYSIRVGSHRIGGTLSHLLILPLAVPTILIAIGTLFVFARIGLVNTTLGLVLSHTMLAIHFVVIVVSAGLSSYDFNQEMAARSLGASRAKAFFTITLPQIKFSLFTSLLFSFYVSFDEVIVAMFISNGPAGTLNRKMFSALRDQVDPTIAAISTCMVLVSIVLVVLAQILKPKPGGCDTE